eukprot:GHRQ01017685.1.p1 GENE.GHRQ01017685.1~~GHRQ01017685.1.p1  ORF type:complete len:144 (+),score=34.85 GHRQ01017685.1:181-612(+)
MAPIAAENVVYGREFAHILCDLDDCLYRIEVIPQSVAQNIKRYMVDKLGVSEEAVHDLCRELYHGYGTTMCGLLSQGYQLDVDDWHAAVHDSLEYDTLLHEQPLTRQVRQRAASIGECSCQSIWLSICHSYLCVWRSAWGLVW